MSLEALAMITTLATSTTHLASLVNYLIGTYFIHLNAVLIVHNSSHRSDFQRQYLNDVQLAFSNQSANGDCLTGLLWMDVAGLQQDDFEQQMLRAVEIVIEGFITILPDTLPFLHARYYATRIAQLRLKDKFHLFLCDEHENPEDLLATEILQFYPHHLMVRPQSKQTKPKNTTLNKFLVSDNIGKVGPKARITTELLEPTVKDARVAFSSQLRDINFELWTQKFVGASGNLDAILLDAFLPNETFAHNVELYPYKLSNLKGRTLKVGSITYVPYVVTNYVAPGTGNVDPINPNEGNLSVFYYGAEAEVMITFCQLHNCHLRVRPYGADNWGAIYKNESSTGMLGDVYEQQVEMAIGCIYNWYDILFEVSHNIACSSVTILGPAPDLTPPWYTNIAPFSTALWIFVAATMFICSMALYLINISPSIMNTKRQENQQVRKHLNFFEKAFLDVFAVFLQQPSAPIGLKRLAGRIFLTFVLVATITLENTYSGQLKSLLAVPLYMKPVDTIEKWSKTNWKWGAPSYIWIESIEKSTIRTEQILVNNFRVEDYEKLYNKSFENEYGLGLERLLSGTFTFGKYITPQIMDKKIILKDDLYYDFTVAVSIRGWATMPLLNKHIRTCNEAGLYEYWERKYVIEFLDRPTEALLMNSAYGRKKKEPPKRLNIENIAGAIFALIFGHLVAITAFLFEIFGHTVQRNLLKIISIFKKI